MMKHYADDPSDPFRALWLYIIQHELTPEQAKLDLQKRYESRDEQWGWVLVAIMLDDITEEQAFKAILTGTRDNTLLAQRLTETYFYLAKRYHMNGDYANAISLYKLAVSFNVYEYVEHRYSFLELSRIFSTLKAEHLAQSKLAAAKLAEAEEEAKAK